MKAITIEVPDTTFIFQWQAFYTDNEKTNMNIKNAMIYTEEVKDGAYVECRAVNDGAEIDWRLKDEQTN